MKRTALLVLGVMVFSIGAFAQPQDDPIATALMALPAGLRDAATVIKWKADFTYDTLKKGTNGLVCYDRSGMPEQQPVSIECSSMGNLEREAQNLKAEALGDKIKTQGHAGRHGKERNTRQARVPVRCGITWPARTRSTPECT